METVNYRDLKVWQASNDLAAFIIRMADTFQGAASRELATHLASSAITLVTGISISWEEPDREKKIQGLRQAISQTFILENLAFLSARMNLLQEKLLGNTFQVLKEIRKMLNELIEQAKESK